MLVVAGADRIGLAGLESLARQCRRVGVRLVLLLERPRGDLKELLGSSDSATILMRLGNAQDAAAAAEFIGRGHKMVLSQSPRKSVRPSLQEPRKPNHRLQGSKGCAEVPPSNDRKRLHPGGSVTAVRDFAIAA
jgi:hypothetical protein